MSSCIYCIVAPLLVLGDCSVYFTQSSMQTQPEFPVFWGLKFMMSSRRWNIEETLLQPCSRCTSSMEHIPHPCSGVWWLARPSTFLFQSSFPLDVYMKTTLNQCYNDKLQVQIHNLVAYPLNTASRIPLDLVRQLIQTPYDEVVGLYGDWDARRCSDRDFMSH